MIGTWPDDFRLLRKPKSRRKKPNVRLVRGPTGHSDRTYVFKVDCE